MLQYVEKPHLPQGRVCRLILGEKYRNVLEIALKSHFIESIWLKNNNFVDERLAGHCDLMAAHLGKNKLAVLENVYCEEFNNLNTVKIATPQSPQYPYDARLNFCIVGNKLIYNPRTADALTQGLELEKLPCRQGYTKCSVCVIDEKSIITADRKIAEITRKNGIDTLLLNDEGLANLDGFEHGFIGGAAFKVSKNKLAFTGVIRNQCERKRIEDFLVRRNIKAVYLTDKPLFDIGSAIPLIEEL